MKMKRRKLLILPLLFAGLFSFGQIVNMESLRKPTDTTGFAGGIVLNGTYLDNDKVIYTLGFEPNVQFKTAKDLFLIVGDYKITKSQKESYQDAAFLHFRYNYKFSDRLRWEAFSQIQDNKIIKLKYRFLLGTGPRVKVVGGESFRLYLGVIPMYEHEEIDDEFHSINKSVRLSQYVSITVRIGDHAELYTTSYYQPVVGKFSDFRFFNEQKLKIHLVGNLAFNFSGVYTWDSRPPEGAPGRTLHLTSGLQYNF